ncbi:hypothetical protein F4808DRAFT_465745 [Astrocystis sublimbata]|nr:hypothetical protein F4808DRAFT_465745 [Astrocystis sublimbata]
MGGGPEWKQPDGSKRGGRSRTLPRSSSPCSQSSPGSCILTAPSGSLPGPRVQGLDYPDGVPDSRSSSQNYHSSGTGVCEGACDDNSFRSVGLSLDLTLNLDLNLNTSLRPNDNPEPNPHSHNNNTDPNTSFNNNTTTIITIITTTTMPCTPSNITSNPTGSANTTMPNRGSDNMVCHYRWPKIKVKVNVNVAPTINPSPPRSPESSVTSAHATGIIHMPGSNVGLGPSSPILPLDAPGAHAAAADPKTESKANTNTNTKSITDTTAKADTDLNGDVVTKMTPNNAKVNMNGKADINAQAKAKANMEPRTGNNSTGNNSTGNKTGTTTSKSSGSGSSSNSSSNNATTANPTFTPPPTPPRTVTSFNNSSITATRAPNNFQRFDEPVVQRVALPDGGYGGATHVPRTPWIPIPKPKKKFDKPWC